jgi:hypothetical protein
MTSSSLDKSSSCSFAEHENTSGLKESPSVQKSYLIKSTSINLPKTTLFKITPSECFSQI